MKAISLWQPWAHAMAIGVKRVETRHWQTKHRGDIAIHAAKRWTAEERDWWRALHRSDPARWPAEPALGAIVAVVDLMTIETSEELAGVVSPSEFTWGNYQAGRYGWVTCKVRPLRVPMSTAGRQSIWTLHDDVVAQVRAQL